LSIFKSHILMVKFKAAGKALSIQGIKQFIIIPLYKNSLFLLADSLVSSFFGFLFWVVAARLYTESSVGSASAIISSLNLLASISVVGLNLSIIRFLPSSSRPHQLINSSLTLAGLIALVVGGVFISGLSKWSPALLYIRQDGVLLSIFLILVPSLTIMDLIDSIFIAKRSAKLALFTSFIMSVFRIGLLLAMVFIFKDSGIVSAWGLALILILVLSFIWLLPRMQAGYRPLPVLDIKELKNLSRYSAGSYVASLLAQAPSTVLPLLVINVLGPQSNAYFYVAWTIASFISAIPGAVSKSLFVEGAHSPQKIRANVIKSLKFTFILSIPAFIIMALAAKWILLAFGSGYSANAVSFLWIVSLTNVIRGIYTIYIGQLRIQDRIKELVIIQGATSVTMITLSYWAANNFGLVGVGYAWLITHSVIAVILGIRLTLQLKKLKLQEKSSI
jgi:O-antigen/teichoic acid export membrane protein